MSTNKFLTFIGGVQTLITAIATSAGATDGSKIIMTKPDGTLDTSLMPAGIGADTQSIVTTEAIAAGSFVNIAAAGVRLADNSNNRPAHGFVLAAAASGANATVYRVGRNSGLTGLTAGTRYFLGTAGAITATAPSTPNAIIQSLGVAGNETSLPFDYDEPTLIA